MEPTIVNVWWSSIKFMGNIPRGMTSIGLWLVTQNWVPLDIIRAFKTNFGVIMLLPIFSMLNGITDGCNLGGTPNSLLTASMFFLCYCIISALIVVLLA